MDISRLVEQLRDELQAAMLEGVRLELERALRPFVGKPNSRTTRRQMRAAVAKVPKAVGKCAYEGCARKPMPPTGRPGRPPVMCAIHARPRR